ncbi:MAG: hypothetical protein ACFFG0_39715 [Candidatus Thorarchaeota archaeon]
MKREKYIVNDRYVIILKYSQIYQEKDTTWFGLKEDIFKEENVDFVLFVIQDSDNVLVASYESIKNIPDYVDLAPSNSNYEIHIHPDFYTIRETQTNLSHTLNNFDQLRV